MPEWTRNCFTDIITSAAYQLVTMQVKQEWWDELLISGLLPLLMRGGCAAKKSCMF